MGKKTTLSRIRLRQIFLRKVVILQIVLSKTRRLVERLSRWRNNTFSPFPRRLGQFQITSELLDEWKPVDWFEFTHKLGIIVVDVIPVNRNYLITFWRADLPEVSSPGQFYVEVFHAKDNVKFELRKI